MFDTRTNLAMQVAEEVKRHFPGQVFATVIPRNVRLAEAPSYGKPVTAYDSLSRGSEAYLELAAELIEKKQEIRGQVGGKQAVFCRIFCSLIDHYRNRKGD